MTRMGNQTRLWSCRGLFLLNSSTLTYFGEAPGKQKGKNTSQYFPGLKETKSAVLLPGYVGEAIRGPPHRRPGLRWIFGKWGGPHTTGPRPGPMGICSTVQSNCVYIYIRSSATLSRRSLAHQPQIFPEHPYSVDGGKTNRQPQPCRRFADPWREME